jgi:hypothetical protein
MPDLPLHIGKDLPGINLIPVPASCASHMPKSDVLQRYYADYYATAAEHHTFHEPMRFAHRVLRAMPTVTGVEPLRILDFGGGDGSLAIVAHCLRARRTKNPVDRKTLESASLSRCGTEPKYLARASIVETVWCVLTLILPGVVW